MTPVVYVDGAPASTALRADERGDHGVIRWTTVADDSVWPKPHLPLLVDEARRRNLESLTRLRENRAAIDTLRKLVVKTCRANGAAREGAT